MNHDIYVHPASGGGWHVSFGGTHLTQPIYKTHEEAMEAARNAAKKRADETSNKVLCDIFSTNPNSHNDIE